ncbi:hypothetical protein X566_17865 [Afipia sp. P52-10]|nr:hypothetical protein X566_17865 [Afipia sp. P52-10]
MDCIRHRNILDRLNGLHSRHATRHGQIAEFGPIDLLEGRQGHKDGGGQDERKLATMTCVHICYFFTQSAKHP